MIDVDFDLLTEIRCVPLPDAEYAAKAETIVNALVQYLAPNKFTIFRELPTDVKHNERIFDDCYVINDSERSLRMKIKSHQYFGFHDLRLKINSKRVLYAEILVHRRMNGATIGQTIKLSPHKDNMSYDAAFRSFAKAIY